MAGKTGENILVFAPSRRARPPRPRAEEVAISPNVWSQVRTWTQSTLQQVRYPRQNIAAASFTAAFSITVNHRCMSRYGLKLSHARCSSACFHHPPHILDAQSETRYNHTHPQNKTAHVKTRTPKYVPAMQWINVSPGPHPPYFPSPYFRYLARLAPVRQGMPPSCRGSM